MLGFATPDLPKEPYVELFAVLPIKKLAANLPVAIRDPKGLGSGSDATNLHMNMVPNC